MSNKNPSKGQEKIENMQILISFKLSRCKDTECIGASQEELNQCYKYHNEKDKRRESLQISKEIYNNEKTLIKKLKNEDTYSIGNVFEEFIKNNPLEFPLKKIVMNYQPILNKNQNKENCLNEIEYFYHPLNYKKNPCPQKNRCEKEYCYHYHNNKELMDFQYMRKFLISQENTLFYKIQQSYQEIDNSLEQFESFMNCLKNEKYSSENSQQSIQEEYQNQEYSSEENQEESIEKKSQENQLMGREFFQTLREEIIKEKKEKIDIEQKQEFQQKKPIENTNKNQEELKQPKYLNSQSKNYHSQNVDYKKFTVKKGKFTLYLNQTLSEKYFIYNKEIPFHEDINTEFKNYQIDYNMIHSYICGFLNSFGGRLFLGINDDGIIKGLKLSRGDYDSLLLNIDINLRNYTPKVFPEQITVKRHQILYDEDQNYIIQDYYVLEILVHCNNYKSLYMDHRELVYLKTQASNIFLKQKEQFELINQRENSYFNELLRGDINEKCLEKMSEEELKKLLNSIENYKQKTIELIERKKKNC